MEGIRELLPSIPSVPTGADRGAGGIQLPGAPFLPGLGVWGHPGRPGTKAAEGLELGPWLRAREERQARAWRKGDLPCLQVTPAPAT